jgi:hypothetical protein
MDTANNQQSGVAELKSERWNSRDSVVLLNLSRGFSFPLFINPKDQFEDPRRKYYLANA